MNEVKVQISEVNELVAVNKISQSVIFTFKYQLKRKFDVSSNEI